MIVVCCLLSAVRSVLRVACCALFGVCCLQVGVRSCLVYCVFVCCAVCRELCRVC